MMRQLGFAVVATMLGTLVMGAEDLQPAVNTSAPDRLTPPDRDATRATPAPVAAPDRPASPAAVSAPSAASASAASTAASAKSAIAGSSVGSKSGGSARDRVELENSQITGNRELPKVMYVVPWKKPDLGDFGGRPAKSLLDELLAPVDRDVFKRQNRYFEALQPDAAAPRSGDEK